jgi:hypothetical protein
LAFLEEREREREGHLKISTPPVAPPGERHLVWECPTPTMLPTIKQQQKIKNLIFFRPSYPVSTYFMVGKEEKKEEAFQKNKIYPPLLWRKESTQ